MIVLAGFLVAFVTLVVALFAGGLIASMIQGAPPGGNVQGGEQGSLWYLLFLVLALTNGLSFVYLFWSRRAGRAMRVTLSSVSMLILTALSGANFWNHDSLVPYGVQAAIDFAMVLLGLIASRQVSHLPVEAEELKVFRAAVVALLLFAGVCLPGLYGTVWVLAVLHRRGYSLRSTSLTSFSPRFLLQSL